MCTFVCVGVACVHVCACMCLYVYMCVLIHVCMCMHVCLYVHVCAPLYVNWTQTGVIWEEGALLEELLSGLSVEHLG